MSWDNIVNEVTGFSLDDRGSNINRNSDITLSALRPTQSPFQRVSGILLHRDKAVGE